MEKNNIGGFLAKEANRITEGPISEPMFAAPVVTAQALCRTYQELLRSGTDDQEWRFMNDLESFLLDSDIAFGSFYYRCEAPRDGAMRAVKQKRSFIQKLFPKLKEIPIQIGVQVNPSGSVQYSYIVLTVPFMTGFKYMTLGLRDSEALLIGDFPDKSRAPCWLVIDADKIDFIHPVVPEGLRPFVAASLALNYGWLGAQHEPSQLLLENVESR